MEFNKNGLKSNITSTVWTHRAWPLKIGHSMNLKKVGIYRDDLFGEGLQLKNTSYPTSFVSLNDLSHAPG